MSDRDAEPDPRGELPASDARAAVPGPRPARTEDGATLALALGAVGLLVWIVAPVAWWLAARSARTLREAGSDVPGTTRTALALGFSGTVLLVLALTCLAPALLFG